MYEIERWVGVAVLARISRQDGAVIAPGGVRSARRRPKSVAVATVEAFDAAGGPPGAMTAPSW